MGTVAQPVPTNRPAEDKGDDTNNVSAELLSLYTEFEAHQQEGSSAAFGPRDPALRVKDGAVLMDCTATEDGAMLLRDLEALGLFRGSVYGTAVSGWLPIAAIPELARLPSLGLARASQPATGAGEVERDPPAPESR